MRVFTAKHIEFQCPLLQCKWFYSLGQVSPTYDPRARSSAPKMFNHPGPLHGNNKLYKSCLFKCEEEKKIVNVFLFYFLQKFAYGTEIFFPLIILKSSHVRNMNAHRGKAGSRFHLTEIFIPLSFKISTSNNFFLNIPRLSFKNGLWWFYEHKCT